MSERIAVIQLKLKEKEYVCGTVDKNINLRIREKANYRLVKTSKKGLKVKLRKEESKNVITIISVYAPGSEIATKDSKELEKLYGQLGKLLENHKRNSCVDSRRF